MATILITGFLVSFLTRKNILEIYCVKRYVILIRGCLSMREKWSSRSAFILAAIGSAVGLGNAWRFPGLAAKYGGGAFLFVYLLAMLVIGIPLLMMEISARRFQRYRHLDLLRSGIRMGHPHVLHELQVQGHDR